MFKLPSFIIVSLHDKTEQVIKFLQQKQDSEVDTLEKILQN